MRAGPMAAEIQTASFGDFADAETGSICGNESAGTAMSFDAFEKRALDFEIFGDDFDDPIGLGAPIEIIFQNFRFELSARNPPRKMRRDGI